MMKILYLLFFHLYEWGGRFTPFKNTLAHERLFWHTFFLLLFDSIQQISILLPKKKNITRHINCMGISVVGFAGWCLYVTRTPIIKFIYYGPCISSSHPHASRGNRHVKGLNRVVLIRRSFYSLWKYAVFSLFFFLSCKLDFPLSFLLSLFSWREPNPLNAIEQQFFASEWNE